MKTSDTPIRNRPPGLLVIATFIFIPTLLAIISPAALSQDYFNSVGENPFGMNFTPSANDLVFHALADIDGDGDLDDFVSHREYIQPCWVVSAFEFYENQGTSECPEFAKIPGETFGLPALTAAIAFVDIDADGDLDAFISNHCYQAAITFHENTGSATQPQFSNTPTQTFGTITGIGFAMLAFGDLDGDGDYDALINGLRPAQFIYLENTGTPAAFAFTLPVVNPFGLSIPSFNSSEWSQFADWDCDGDLDILNSHWQMNGSHNDWMLYIHINNGTSTAPSFLSPINTNQLVMAIALGDMDGDGDEDVFSDEYYFKNITTTGCVSPPTAGFSTIKNGLTVEFVNESDGQETDCNPIHFLWNFGDGTTGNETAPTHTYATEGTYLVTLTMEDIAGQAVFSENVAVTTSAVAGREKAEEVMIFPNPASDFLTVKLAGNILPGQQVTIELSNSLGEVFRQYVLGSPDFATGIRLEVGDLASGFYTLKINYGERFLSGRFLKVE